jgi:hypothetical protein
MAFFSEAVIRVPLAAEHAALRATPAARASIIKLDLKRATWAGVLGYRISATE